MLSGCLNLILGLRFQLCLVNEDLQSNTKSVLMDQFSQSQLASLPGVFQTCSLRAVLSESLTLI